ncbi:acyltransferase family protein [Clostridium sp. 'White wine YQ']|uniref:acyltransferase family protein n=1 Tax=Clostridium sp. 'White wine YQ' TaxID=3027474 RepID=UPI002365E4DB|nr:acyltransferase [Clostridium sp. 'White wine YQ']MDD7795412.1 acyltransferase [Clostridium sp. 'White wine YQ']
MAILLVLIGIALLSFKRTGQAIEKSIALDKLCTKELKGIAIILVILGHMSIDKHIFIVPNLIYAGAWGVALFLILSGFGITKSYLSNGISFRTLIGRITSILIPYSVVTLVWIIIDWLYFHKSYSPKTIILVLMGIDGRRSIDASMWYISMILFCYIIFYITFRLPLKNYIRVLLLFCFSYLIYRGHFSGYLLDLSYNWQLSAFSFPIGVLLALYSEKIKDYFYKKNIVYLFLLFAVVFFFLFIILSKYITLSLKLYILTNTSFSLLLIILIVLLRYYNFVSRFLQFIGSISYEIYLFEGVLMWKYSLLRIFDNKLISLSLYFGVLLLISFLYNKLIKKIQRSGISKAYPTLNN